MAAPTETYVDPSIAANSGAGTIGDPFGDIQHALDTITRDSTNGDRFNIKTGTDELQSASLTLATYGTPAFREPLVFRGYTSAAADGGIGGINMQGNNNSIIAATTAVHWHDMHLHNTGTAAVIGTGQYGTVIGCELNNTSGNGVDVGVNIYAINFNHFHDIGAIGVDCNLTDRGLVIGNYFKNDGTNDFIDAIQVSSGVHVLRNIISIDGSSNGIDTSAAVGTQILFNSILSLSGTGTGILVRASSRTIISVYNNLVEGFSGVGGVGILFENDARNAFLYGNNAVFNCTTAYSVDTAEVMFLLGDNESLGSTPFAKSGADTFANRFTYFESADVGNVRGGGHPTGARLDKGAVQHADQGGLLIHPGMSGGMRG